jgi:hypothetical protein
MSVEHARDVYGVVISGTPPNIIDLVATARCRFKS